jgi:ABC-type nickel/cobalt efflux system permease component RcnA
LLVLLGAAAIGRPWWGVLLVIAFGIGMALTLAVAGLLAWQVGERVSAWAARRQHDSMKTIVRLFPQLAAVGVCGAGVVVIARGLGIL